MKTELLAPAGSMEALKAAVSAGADAVYLGGAAFGARAYAKNLDEQEILSAIDYVHRFKGGPLLVPGSRHSCEHTDDSDRICGSAFPGKPWRNACGTGP